MFEVEVEIPYCPLGVHPFDVVIDHESGAAERNAFDLIRLDALDDALERTRARLRAIPPRVAARAA